MMPSLLLLLLLVQSAGPGDGRPQALLNMERYRMNLRTAVIQCSIRRPAFGKMALNNATARIAESDLIWTWRGDEQGVVRYNTAGKPAVTVPIHLLKTNGRIWEHQERSASALTYGAQRTAMVADLRTLGVSYGYGYLDVPETIWRDFGSQPGPRKYTESVDDSGMHVVTATTDSGTVKWWIDAERGWSAVRVAHYVDGQLFSESRTTLKQFDGVWFPAEVTCYVKGYEDGKAPQITFRVYDAEFNRPEHPQEFTPETIGVENLKTSVAYYEELGVDMGVGGYYDGDAFISYQQDIAQRAERRRVKLAVDESAESGAQASGNVQSVPESEWEAYTRRFIEKYKLGGDQKQKALAILKSCQEQGRKYLAGRKSQFDRLTRLTKELSAREAKDKAQQLARLAKERRKLRKPIDDIFRKQLKPRLNKLPTRKQRAAAAASAKESPPKP